MCCPRSSFHRLRPASASALVQVVVLSAILLIICVGVLSATRYHLRRQYEHTNWAGAYYAAENALLEGAQKIADIQPGTAVSSVYGTYGKTDMAFQPTSDVTYTSFTIAADPLNEPAFSLVTAQATYGTKTRTLQARVQYRPPSQVFDYEYFLNNWGWWWGGSITGNGNNRSNWDFDYKDSPTLNGHLYATGAVESGKVPVDPFGQNKPFRGWAADDPVTYVHVGVARLKMPNLKDLTYYEAKAAGTIRQDGATLVDRIHGDNEPKPGIYLDGTNKPLQIDGTVVIRGDCVIKGAVTGMGTLYVGGNMYIAGDLTYKNGPTFSLPPNSAGMTAVQRQQWFDNWAAQAFAEKKDLVCYAVRGHVLTGQVNTADWKNACYENNDYGLKLLGREDSLGQDGIKGTPDDGIKYLDTDSDTKPDSAGYDADNDGTVRTTPYNYDTDIKLSDSRRDTIANWPTETINGVTAPASYDSISSKDVRTQEGIIYTNHVLAEKTNSGPGNLRGAAICRDEAIIFSGSQTFWYDWRIHSRNHSKFYDSDGNKIIDLDLPLAYKVRVWDRTELVMAKGSDK